MDPLAQLNDDMLPFAKLLGIRFTVTEVDRVVAEMKIGEALCTRPAVAHGGALMAFADTLGAAGTILNLPDGAATTTIESKTNFLAAASVGSTVTGEATPVHRGRPHHGLADPGDDRERPAGGARHPDPARAAGHILSLSPTTGDTK